MIAERGPEGVRLVDIDEHGNRRLDLVAPPAQVARDTHPALSPDGRWLVFASSRGRTQDGTNLWIAPLAPDATPRPLTPGPWIDSHPTWTPDGRAIVFASTRAGSFDLYRLAIAAGRAAGAPERLTSAPGHEVTPTVAADGSIIYASVTPGAGGEVESHLERRGPDGTIARLTDGPGDSSPALAPDGQTLAFVRPAVRANGTDADLWLLRPGAPATRLVDLPLTDEGGPVWSADGRFVFATSVLRGEHGVVFSSVIVIDARAAHPVARVLEDHVGPIARLTPAVARTRLDAAALDANPEYLPELARIVGHAIAERARAGQGSP